PDKSSAAQPHVKYLTNYSSVAHPPLDSAQEGVVKRQAVLSDDQQVCTSRSAHLRLRGRIREGDMPMGASSGSRGVPWSREVVQRAIWGNSGEHA
ncbi:hypothetical protein CJ201_07530, partial [Corynebacterium aurimucosum]